MERGSSSSWSGSSQERRTSPGPSSSAEGWSATVASRTSMPSRISSPSGRLAWEMLSKADQRPRGISTARAYRRWAASRPRRGSRSRARSESTVSSCTEPEPASDNGVPLVAERGDTSALRRLAVRRARCVGGRTADARPVRGDTDSFARSVAPNSAVMKYLAQWVLRSSVGRDRGDRRRAGARARSDRPAGAILAAASLRGGVIGSTPDSGSGSWGSSPCPAAVRPPREAVAGP